MKLWILEAAEEHELWHCWYDKMFSIVVRAETEQQARVLASRECGDESPLAWLNSECSTCKELHHSGESGTVIINFASA